MKNLHFIALHDRVVIVPADEQGCTAGGILIPEVARAAKVLAKGEVVAVGGGRTNLEGRTVPLMVRCGDLAIYDRKAGQPIPWGDGEAIVVREPEILGVYRADTSLAAFVRHLNSTAPDEPEHDEPHPALPGES